MQYRTQSFAAALDLSLAPVSKGHCPWAKGRQLPLLDNQHANFRFSAEPATREIDDSQREIRTLAGERTARIGADDRCRTNQTPSHRKLSIPSFIGANLRERQSA